MSKYTLLIILNIPFVLFGLLKAYTMLKSGVLGRVGFGARLLFWAFVALGIVFAKQVYNFLQSNDLTDSQPMSLADVVLVTGVIFCLFLCMRLYSRLEAMERRATDLHQKLSIMVSEMDKKR